MTTSHPAAQPAAPDAANLTVPVATHAEGGTSVGQRAGPGVDFLPALAGPLRSMGEAARPLITRNGRTEAERTGAIGRRTERRRSSKEAVERRVAHLADGHTSWLSRAGVLTAIIGFGIFANLVAASALSLPEGATTLVAGMLTLGEVLGAGAIGHRLRTADRSRGWLWMLIGALTTFVVATGVLRYRRFFEDGNGYGLPPVGAVVVLTSVTAALIVMAIWIEARWDAQGAKLDREVAARRRDVQRIEKRCNALDDVVAEQRAHLRDCLGRAATEVVATARESGYTVTHAQVTDELAAGLGICHVLEPVEAR